MPKREREQSAAIGRVMPSDLVLTQELEDVLASVQSLYLRIPRGVIAKIGRS